MCKRGAITLGCDRVHRLDGTPPASADMWVRDDGRFDVDAVGDERAAGMRELILDGDALTGADVQDARRSGGFCGRRKNVRKMLHQTFLAGRLKLNRDGVISHARRCKRRNPRIGAERKCTWRRRYFSRSHHANLSIGRIPV